MPEVISENKITPKFLDRPRYLPSPKIVFFFSSSQQIWTKMGRPTVERALENILTLRTV